jgi:hypothetical protein
MAYDPKLLRLQSSADLSSATATTIPRQWYYGPSDDDITAAGYVADAPSVGLKVGDLITQFSSTQVAQTRVTAVAAFDKTKPLAARPATVASPVVKVSN